MVVTAKSKFVDGTVLQLASSVTLGQPFEVWKTHMGRYRSETTSQAFMNIYRSGGVAAFWKGMGPKLFESATKGGVLMVAKDACFDGLCKVGVPQTTSGFVSGAMGGVAQTIVMGPSTFLVTAMVLGKEGATLSTVISRTWKEKGLVGFYPGGSAVAARQASNWASRQGFTEAVRSQIGQCFHGDKRARLSVKEEAMAGIVGGTLSCWNHPFEVARVEMQACALSGDRSAGLLGTMRSIHAEYGMWGLFQGLIPRMGLNIWLTLFMVSGVHLLKSARERELFAQRPKLQLTRSGVAAPAT